MTARQERGQRAVDVSDITIDDSDNVDKISVTRRTRHALMRARVLCAVTVWESGNEQ